MKAEKEADFIKRTGLFKNLENNVIKIPEHCTSIKIDVGLAGDAPNSALWLKGDPHVFVIGIEPLEYHCQHLYELGKPDNNTHMQHPRWPIIQLKHNAVLLNREKTAFIKYTKDYNFELIHYTNEEFFFINKRFKDLAIKQKIPFWFAGT